jgi:hypothetical protein
MKKTIIILIYLSIVPLNLYSQSCPTDSCYLVLKILSNDQKKPFLFEGSYVTRGGNKKSRLKAISGNTPFEIKIANSVAYFLVRGVKGDGKLLLKYKTSTEEKESFQYLGTEEVASIRWTPLSSGGAMVGWGSKKKDLRMPDELSVQAFTNQ